MPSRQHSILRERDEFVCTSARTLSPVRHLELRVFMPYRGEDRNPIEIAVRLPKSALVWSEAMASTPSCRANSLTLGLQVVQC